MPALDELEAAWREARADARFREELGDALAYFIEICIFAGISPVELYEEYCRKNAIVQKRVKDGY